MTREQIQRLYSIQLNSYLNKKAKKEKERDDKDRIAWQKTQEANAKRSMMLTGAELYKDLKESHEMSLMRQTYDENIEGILGKKFERKDPRSLGELVDPRNWGESAKRLLPGKLGAYQETEGYKEFQLLEEIGESADETFDEESLIGWINPDTGKQGTAAEYDSLTQRAKYKVTEEVATEVSPLTLSTGKVVEDPTAEFDADAIREALKTAESGSQEKFELRQQLEYIKTFSAEELEEIKASAEQKVADVSQQFIEDEKSFLFEDPGVGTVGDGVLGEEFIESGIGSEYTAELEEWEKDLGIGEDGVFTADELENMRASAAITLPTGAPSAGVKPAELILDERILADPGKAPQLTNEEIAKRLGLQSADQISKEDIQSAKEMFPDLSQEEALSQYYSYGDVEGIVSTGAETIEDIAALEGGDTVPTVGAPTVPSADIVPDVKPDAPDAKPGFGGKALQAAQTFKQLTDIGKTLTDEDATGEDRAIAGTQGVKMLADLAAKKAGQQTASQIGAKALTKKGYEQLTKEGVKMGGKAAVGAAAGGILGGYTMVTEAGEAGEAWEEKDYDEAILHGIGSVSGGLQTAGAGMMLTGVGAPLGAVLYGVGTAASAISSAGLFLEGLFGGDGGAPAVQGLPKQKFDVSSYINTLRQRERR